jgi:dihydroneopterin aldolase
MDDTCEIREIRIPCRIGVDAWEADCLQTLSVDLRLPLDVAAAAASDDIAQTVDYRAVADGVFKAQEGRHVRLVETVAESVAAWVLSHANVAWVEVSVTKEIAKTAAKTATISIHRRRA